MANQPCLGASMMDHTSAVTAASDSTTPIRSSRSTCAARDSGTVNSTAAMAASATGTLIQNTECQEKYFSSQPPTVGPMATATPAMAVHSAMAAARSRLAVKILVISASVAGKTTAANTPMPARAAMT